MPASLNQHLSPDAIARISQLEIDARRVVEGFLSGQHRSPYFGQSVEFVQHREYVPGDDIRRIDWKAWSKTDRYYVKQYEEETNLRTTLVVDVSESMQFASGKVSKYQYGCSIAAAISYLLLRQQDAVNLLAFDSEVRGMAPSRTRQSHLGSLLTVLESQKLSNKTEMFSILQTVAEQKTQKGMVVLISDLFSPPESLYRGLRLLRQRGHDVLVFHILDDEELDFTYSGITKFEGLESTGELVCDPRALREGYQQALQTFLENLRRQCAGDLVDYQTIRTSEHVDAVLRKYLQHRLGLGRR